MTLKSKDKKRISQMWSKINRNMNTEDRAAFAIWKLHLWLLADFARDCARLCHKQYVTDAVSDVFEEVNEIPTLMSGPGWCCSNELKQVVQLEQENAKLRAVMRQARAIALASGVTMREFAKNLGITATQLSAWTDETPDREPDFKD